MLPDLTYEEEVQVNILYGLSRDEVMLIIASTRPPIPNTTHRLAKLANISYARVRDTLLPKLLEQGYLMPHPRYKGYVLTEEYLWLKDHIAAILPKLSPGMLNEI